MRIILRASGFSFSRTSHYYKSTAGYPFHKGYIFLTRQLTRRISFGILGAFREGSMSLFLQRVVAVNCGGEVV